MKFRELLRAARIRCGLTQEQVARAVGITRASFNAYESGIVAPSIDKAVSLSRKLGFSLDDITEPTNRMDAKKDRKDQKIRSLKARLAKLEMADGE